MICRYRRRHTERQRTRFIIRNWLTLSWKLTNVEICSQQAGVPGELTRGSGPKTWEQENCWPQQVSGEQVSVQVWVRRQKKTNVLACRWSGRVSESSYSVLGSTRDFSGLDQAHPLGRAICFTQPTNSVFISARNTLMNTARIMSNQISEDHVAQSHKINYHSFQHGKEKNWNEPCGLEFEI